MGSLERTNSTLESNFIKATIQYEASQQELRKLNKDYAFKEKYVANQEVYVQEVEEEKRKLKNVIQKQEDQQHESDKKLKDLYAILQSVILSLKKVKLSYDDNQKRILSLKKENDMLRDVSGIDLTQLTPRP